jgi:hypothetical protein
MSLVTESIIWGGLENIPLGSLTPKEQQERRALLGVQFMEKQKYEVSNRVETSATAKHGVREPATITTRMPISDNNSNNIFGDDSHYDRPVTH